jgi:hypothetical protein
MAVDRCAPPAGFGGGGQHTGQQVAMLLQRIARIECIVVAGALLLSKDRRGLVTFAGGPLAGWAIAPSLRLSRSAGWPPALPLGNSRRWGRA